jgi:threonine/homoserine/homoserine lactone efflux protein
MAGLIQIPLLAIGVASLIQSSPLAFDTPRYSRAAYLIWHGVQLIGEAGMFAPCLRSTKGTTPLPAMRDGIIASLTNPKGLIFLLAFLPQFVEPARHRPRRHEAILGSFIGSAPPS